MFMILSNSISIRDYPTLENCLFGAVTLTKNADLISISTNIRDTEFDLIEVEAFYLLAQDYTKM